MLKLCISVGKNVEEVLTILCKSPIINLTQLHTCVIPKRIKEEQR